DGRVDGSAGLGGVAGLDPDVVAALAALDGHGGATGGAVAVQHHAVSGETQAFVGAEGDGAALCIERDRAGGIRAAFQREVLAAEGSGTGGDVDAAAQRHLGAAFGACGAVAHGHAGAGEAAAFHLGLVGGGEREGAHGGEIHTGINAEVDHGVAAAIDLRVVRGEAAAGAVTV